MITFRSSSKMADDVLCIHDFIPYFIWNSLEMCGWNSEPKFAVVVKLQKILVRISFE